MLRTLARLMQALGISCPNGNCGGTMTKSGNQYRCPKCGYMT